MVVVDTVVDNDVIVFMQQNRRSSIPGILFLFVFYI